MSGETTTGPAAEWGRWQPRSGRTGSGGSSSRVEADTAPYARRQPAGNFHARGGRGSYVPPHARGQLPAGDRAGLGAARSWEPSGDSGGSGSSRGGTGAWGWTGGRWGGIGARGGGRGRGTTATTTSPRGWAPFNSRLYPTIRQWGPSPVSPHAHADPPPLGQLILALNKGDLDADADDYTSANLAKISHFRVVGSYNWVDRRGEEPHILIPGQPARWTPLNTTPTLLPDSGRYFRDPNAARFPRHPVEPAVAVSLRADPGLPSRTDVFACSSTLGNLLRLVLGRAKSFRILVEQVSGTVFLVRRENSARDMLPGVVGFGHTFPEANTTWDRAVRGSSSNQRILRYRFGGLRLVVRCETDGYIGGGGDGEDHDHDGSGPDDTGDVAGDGEEDEAGQPEGGGSTVDSLAEQFVSSVALTSSPSGGGGGGAGRDDPTEATTLRFVPAGMLVPQSGIINLKTRSIRTRGGVDMLQQELPRMWATRIPNFILAYHHDGLFHPENTSMIDVRAAVRDWERDHADDLASFGALVNRIVREVSDRPDLKLELVHDEKKKGTLELREQLPDAGDILSEATRAEWEAGLAEAYGSDDSSEEDGDESGEETDPAKDGPELAWWDNDDDSDKDYTACTPDCGYCGNCELLGEK